MTITVRLEPLHKHGEVLRSDVQERPVLYVPTDGSIITLGKNSTTQIADSGLKRKCVSLQFRNQNQLKVFSAISAIVSVNGRLVEEGELLLVAGDILALHAPRIAYQYKVVVHGGSLSRTEEKRIVDSLLLDSDEDGYNAASKSTGIPATVTAHSHHKINPHKNTSVADELSCAFCLEILVCATTLVPCGHSFCRSCLVNVKECPTCRASVQTTVHCRTVDNAIAAMVAQPNPPLHAVFAPDDIEKYHERVRQPVKHKKSTASPTSDRKRRKKASISDFFGRFD